MRHGTSGRRSRNRGNGNRRNNDNRIKVFDSNGPDVRIRGTPHQIYDKYAALAKDAAASGDRVLAESYLQYAEHYQRIITGWDDVLNGRTPEQKESYSPVCAAEPANEMEAPLPSPEDLGLPESIVGRQRVAEEV